MLLYTCKEETEKNKKKGEKDMESVILTRMFENCGEEIIYYTEKRIDRETTIINLIVKSKKYNNPKSYVAISDGVECKISTGKCVFAFNAEGESSYEERLKKLLENEEVLFKFDILEFAKAYI